MTNSGSIHRMYLYILKCTDDTYYTGISNNLEKRFKEHQIGIHSDAYTYRRRPVELVFWTGIASTWEAIKLEKQIKNWSRKKKEALIKGDYDNLQNEAKKKFS